MVNKLTTSLVRLAMKASDWNKWVIILQHRMSLT